MLSLFCAPASAEICSSFLDVVKTLFVGTPSSFETAVDVFSPDADMKVATNGLKKLADSIPENKKDSIMRLMVRGVSPHAAGRQVPQVRPAQLRGRPIFQTLFSSRKESHHANVPTEANAVISLLAKRLLRNNQSPFDVSSS